MALYVIGSLTEGQCGIGRLRCHTLFNFATPKEESRWLASNSATKILPDDPLTLKQVGGGTGLFGTGFVNTAPCKAVWDHLVKHHHCVLQTPVRLNTNSNNQFFYAMFDLIKNEDGSYVEPKWPFPVV